MNFDERLEVLLKDYNGYDFCGDIACSGQNKARELTQAITELIKDLVEECKPEYMSPDQPLGLKYQGRNEAIREFEQNILKTLEVK